MTPAENNELVKYRFDKARETFAEAEFQMKGKLWNLAINRLYYACFYAVGALLASKGIYTKTHTGAKQMLSLHFVKTGIIDKPLNDLYIKMFSLRQSGDYEDYCDYEEEDVIELIEPAREFITAIEHILFKN